MRFKIDQNLPPNQIALLRKIFPLFATTAVAGRLWIVEEGKVRVRGEPR